MTEIKKPRIIVVGNEKGGSGKTTTSMHLIAYLLHLGHQVGSIDVDIRQLSLSRYIENRERSKLKSELLMPKHFKITPSRITDEKEREAEEAASFTKAMESCSDCEYIVIDTPGSYSHLSRLAHSYADIVVTPMNDSFLDLDLLAKIDGTTMNIIGPSIYSQMLWEQKLARAKRDSGQILWVVLRNRLSFTDAINKRNVGEALEKLSKRIGFVIAEGFSERVIFRELFLQGLTLLDLKNISMTMSHVAARQELRKLIKSIGIHEQDSETVEALASEEV